MQGLIFRQATIDDAYFIAKGFHEAMLMADTPDDRVRMFAETVCVRDDVLYCARNTIIAESEGRRVGMLTSYDGSRYHDMRIKTFDIVKKVMGVEFPGMQDEAKEGEYYLDSLAVVKEFRGNGVGRALLEEGIRRGKETMSPRPKRITLAVDPVNVRAQKLYESLGFKRAEDIFIFGHTYWMMEIVL